LNGLPNASTNSPVPRPTISPDSETSPMEALVTPRGGAAPIDVDGFRPSPACCASHSATNASHGSTFFDGSPRSSQLRRARRWR